MLSLAHTLISLPFAFYFEHPLFIFAAAVVAHVLADTLLHWNLYPDQFKRYPHELVALDIGAGLIAAWGLTGEAFWTLPVWAAIAGGNAPDVLHGVWDLFGKKHPLTRRGSGTLAPGFLTLFFHWHDRLQLETTSLGRGLISQVVLIVLAAVLVFAKTADNVI